MTDDVWREFFNSCAPQYMSDWQAVDGSRSLQFRERGCVPSAVVLLCRGAGFPVDGTEIMAVLRRPPA